MNKMIPPTSTQSLQIGSAPSDGFAFDGSRMMASWLESQNVSLVFTTYDIGKIFMVGVGADGRLSFSERTFPRVMGVCAHENGFWVGGLYQLLRFDNYLRPGTRFNKGSKSFDGLYVPSMSYSTGDVDTHDIHVQGDTPTFVATRFNCLAQPLAGKSFKAVWRPPFIDRFAAEDRCHLNGMAMDAEGPRYVTCVSQTNVAESWREHRREGGVVVDVRSGEIVASGLSMPHSPRLHDGALWIIQSGTGELGRIDLASGRFEPLCFLPGFARGLSIVGDWAVVGVSLARSETKVFQGLPLEDRLARERVAPRCMIAVINLKTGDLEHWIQAAPPLSELYDVAVLPNVRTPHLVGVHNEDIRFIIDADQTEAFAPARAGATPSTPSKRKTVQ